jgi:hypothetical protein
LFHANHAKDFRPNTRQATTNWPSQYGAKADTTFVVAYLYALKKALTTKVHILPAVQTCKRAIGKRQDPLEILTIYFHIIPLTHVFE